jgi:riboflavin biosynthesis pyrimidine reductase
VTGADAARIRWHRNTEPRYPHGAVSPAPDRLEALGFPPPWPARPWIYANVIASKNGIVTWKRAGADDDPVRAIAGGDLTRIGRRADLQLMRYLRACGDAFSVGAQTLRDQPDLVGAPDDIDGGLGEALARFRSRQGLPRFPIQIVYSESGRVDLDVPMFSTPALRVIVATTQAGARLLHRQGSDRKGITTLEAGEERIDAAGLVRLHERLLEEFGVRYLVCEGGALVLASLHGAGILDEIFVTSTDVDVEPSQHEGIRRLFAFDAGAAGLIAEGQAVSDPGFMFRRWRFNDR